MTRRGPDGESRGEIEVAGGSDAQLKSGLSVSYDAAAGSYIIDLISADPGPFKATTEETSYWRGYVENQALVVPSVDVRKPADAGFLFTTFGDYYQYEWAPVDFFTGVFAFGLPTLPAGVPTTGSATYSALLAGKTPVDGKPAVYICERFACQAPVTDPSEL